MFKLLFHFGKYLLLIKSFFYSPEHISVYWRLTMREAVNMGIGSLGIVFIISLFMGAVTTVQTAYQLLTPLIPKSAIGSVVSASAILELAPTIMTLVLAGKIGSNIASELGTMRVTEQIDALEVMGINPASYLIIPKIFGALLSFPLLTTISCYLIHIGGIAAGAITEVITPAQFEVGARTNFVPFQITFMLIKSLTFAFIISSVSAYQGFYVKGGALEVGQASTKAVVFSCVMMLLADYVLAQLLL
ncbi:MAG: ABC transporter permease, partial [Bacteroidia bacterium]|nr:ABC transporter permease [Bacteroidia bacterium]